MQIFIEPLESTPTLCLFGAGHVAQPLAHLAKRAGFRVEVVDDRLKFANRERFPEADQVLVPIPVIELRLRHAVSLRVVGLALTQQH